MSIIQVVAAHWVEWSIGVVAAIATWLAANVLGRPLVTFWSERQKVLEAVQEHGAVDYSATQERVSAARHALRSAAAKMLAYDDGGPLVIRLYCRLRGYNLMITGKALKGLHNLVGEGPLTERQKNNADAIRLCLGATSRLSIERQSELRRLIGEAFGNET